MTVTQKKDNFIEIIDFGLTFFLIINSDTLSDSKPHQSLLSP